MILKQKFQPACMILLHLLCKRDGLEQSLCNWSFWSHCWFYFCWFAYQYSFIDFVREMLILYILVNKISPSAYPDMTKIRQLHCSDWLVKNYTASEKSWFCFPLFLLTQLLKVQMKYSPDTESWECNCPLCQANWYFSWLSVTIMLCNWRY